MNLPRVTIAELRRNLAEIAGMVMYSGRSFVVTKNDREAFLLLPVSNFERMAHRTKPLNKRERQKAVAELEAARKNLPDTDPDELEAEISKAVAEVRAKRKQARQSWSKQSSILTS